MFIKPDTVCQQAMPKARRNQAVAPIGISNVDVSHQFLQAAVVDFENCKP